MQNIEVLIVPVISLMGLAFAFSSILRYSQKTKFTNVAFGLLFGASMILAMTFPIRFGEGFIFDLRTLLLGLCVVFTGWRAGLIALGMAVSFRLFLGGGGMVTGVTALFLAYGIACAWRSFGVPRIKSATVADFGLGIAVSGSLAATVLLPKEMALVVLQDLAPILTVANILGAMAIGFMFRREMKFFQDSEKLRLHAMIDPLTNLLNRRGTEESLRNIIHRKGEGRAMICFDMDDFKRINDQYGHEAGDIVLSTIATRLENALRGEIIFSRHGGDEFTIYFPSMESGAIGSVADRLCRTVAKEPVTYRGDALKVTISIGCYWTKQVTSFADMLRRADEQLLKSKESGRNRATVYLDFKDEIRLAAQPPLAYAGSSTG